MSRSKTRVPKASLGVREMNLELAFDILGRWHSADPSCRTFELTWRGPYHHVGATQWRGGWRVGLHSRRRRKVKHMVHYTGGTLYQAVVSAMRGWGSLKVLAEARQMNLPDVHTAAPAAGLSPGGGQVSPSAKAFKEASERVLGTFSEPGHGPEFQVFVCASCGGQVRLIACAGRTREYKRGIFLEVPDSMEIPTCSGCGETYWDGRLSEAFEKHHNLTS